MAPHLLAFMQRIQLACKNLQNISLQSISCHPREHARDASEMTTVLVRSPKAASTQDEPLGRQKAREAETAEYTTGLL
jgi:hypothetical protein